MKRFSFQLFWSICCHLLKTCHCWVGSMPDLLKFYTNELTPTKTNIRMTNQRLINQIKLAIVCMIFLSSCITAERCRDRFPCAQETKVVTTIRDTTIVTNRVSTDTIFRWSFRDTVFLRDHETRIETKLIRLKGDSVYIKTTCPPDTIRVEKIIQTSVTTTENDNEDSLPWKWWVWIILIIAIVFAVAVLIKQIKR